MIPHTRITRNNIRVLKETLTESIKNASYIGLDVEFSGLGRDKQCRAENVNDRYQALCKHVSKYSILALGISTYRLKEENENEKIYHCANYEILMVNQQPFMFDASSMSFLVESGFDFNVFSSEGVPFWPQGSVDATKDADILEYTEILILIFRELLDSGAAVIVHNGLLDLMFIYHSLYGPLPSSLSIFVADLSEMFSSGIYDTKYISSYELREEKTYLSYLFRKFQMHQGKRRNQNLLHISCEVESSKVVEVEKVVKNRTKVCHSYMYHGHCRLGKRCNFSHDVDLVLRIENGEKISDSDIEEELEEDETVLKRVDFPHTAFYDAFMTVFVFCHQILIASSEDVNFSKESSWNNLVYVMGKQIPLRLEKSKFTANSTHHKNKKKKRQKIKE